MHPRRPVFAFLTAVLLLLAPLVSARSWAQRGGALAPEPVDGRVSSDTTSSWAASWRDAVISTVFGLSHEKQSATPAHARTTSGKRRRPAPPTNIRARFSGDVVLRFTVKTAEDAKALVEASNILFLDIWGASKDWVDIRLGKDMVGHDMVVGS